MARSTSDARRERFAEQRRALPDGPGVYLFRDREGRVIYVGKARSIKKRVASHFVNPVTRGAVEMVDVADSIDFVLVSSETEALLVENRFIKQYQPEFNIRLRDDKSYPYVCVTLDEDYPRVYLTREKHKAGRRYFGPYSNAKRVRHTLDLLGRLFQFRTCEGREPGRRSGSPCLDFHIDRCTAPCVGYVTREEYRDAIDGVMSFLSGRYREIEEEIEARMHDAAAAQEYERAARERDRLQAVRSLLERQRVSGESIGTLDAIAVTVEGDDANAQVFQVRDGSLTDRHSFYLSGVSGEVPEVVEQFLLRYYGATTIPPTVLVPDELDEADVAGLAGALRELRGARVEVLKPQRGGRRRLLDMARRNAELALGQERLKAERQREQRVEALGDLQRILGLERMPMRVECYDISHLMGTETVASMVVLEGGAPANDHYRRFVIRDLEDDQPDDFRSMNEVLRRRLSQWTRQQEKPVHEPGRDASFASLPDLIVIDGGKGQLSAGLAALEPFLERGVAVVSLAKRIEEVFLPGRPDPIVLGHDTPALQLLQRVRDEAHRFAITHHRGRRDRRMTGSVLDDLTGVGPARKKALLAHFGSPDRIVGASREELEATPGLPGKIAREIYAQLHRTRTGE
ncbi:excinuclease ABC subunit UvrC [Patulibacter brassicae]|uniref:UvrABC system protein C n=1 Tax=Patulibacter brassicae TaxID=1705717 RepID=A0ABU4VNN4_9ACTN|nr:excinuclease ABC subunit UvrC [Patulibacter brassicae]MDX8153463.1 excinuclease ABC subunit UvrC [Patulibacter brassicae]